MTKKHVFVLLICSLFLTAASCQPKDTTSDTSSGKEKMVQKESKKQKGKYELKEGTITYTLEGNRTGEKIVYIRNYGWDEATYTKATTTAGTVEVPEETISIRSGDTVRNYDVLTGKGTLMTIPKDIMGLGVKEGEMMVDAMGGEKSGIKQIAGKQCEVTKIANLGTETCTWKTVPLLTTSQMGPVTVSETATQVTEGPPPADKFELPIADRELQDMSGTINRAFDL